MMVVNPHASGDAREWVLEQRLDYVHNNPVEAGIVRSSEDLYIAVHQIIKGARR